MRRQVILILLILCCSSIVALVQRHNRSISSPKAKAQRADEDRRVSTLPPTVARPSHWGRVSGQPTDEQHESLVAGELEARYDSLVYALHLTAEQQVKFDQVLVDLSDMRIESRDDDVLAVWTVLSHEGLQRCGAFLSDDQMGILKDLAGDELATLDAPREVYQALRDEMLAHLPDPIGATIKFGADQDIAEE